MSSPGHRKLLAPRIKGLIKTIVASVALFAVTPLIEAAPPTAAIVISATTDGVPVVALTNEVVRLDSGQRGIVVWTDREGEHWQIFEERWSPNDVASLSRVQSGFAGRTRALDNHSLPGPADTRTTTLLASHSLPDVFRNPGEFLTPYNRARLSHPRIVFRRQAATDGSDLPAAEATVSRSGIELIRVSFGVGQTRVAWNDITGVPDDLQDGLTPGLYELALPTTVGVERIRFAVQPADAEGGAWPAIRQLEEALSPNHPLVIQLTVEELMWHDPPLLCDALNVIEQVPDAERTDRLHELHTNVLERLKDPDQRVARTAAPGLPTGDDAIDAVREQIAAGQWERAVADLDELESAESLRRRGLAGVYRAVVMSESAASDDERVSKAFRDAIELLENDADRFRAHLAFANFLMGRTNDLLHNHAFQMATGVRYPLMTMLHTWLQAKQQYEHALTYAQESDQRAGIRISMARLYAVLADTIRTLGDPAEPDSRLLGAEQAAVTQAIKFAELVLHDEDVADPVLQAIAEEVLALIRFRTDDSAGATEHARRALEGYTNSGSLAGMESAWRLLGLCERSDGTTARTIQDRLRPLLVAQQLAEVLRHRYPADQYGLSRAGFLARRTAVTERIIELLIEEGEFVRALEQVEFVKARSLQDVLAARGMSVKETGAGHLSDLLKSWPPDVVMLEYFIGSQRAWAFLIDHDGQVSAQLLTQPDGAPLLSRSLVSNVYTCLVEMDSYSKQMYRRILSGKGFDHSWQDTLFEFYRTLVPEAFAPAIGETGTLVIVPHHVLHYFPFAALVTELDNNVPPAGSLEMVNPRFLIDDPIELVMAPSLDVWWKLRDSATPVTTVNAIGVAEFDSAPSLPGVEADLRQLREAFGQRVQTFVEGRSATEQSAFDVLRQPGLLFIATHGLNVADQPLSSYLLCRREGESDGHLTAAEIFDGQVGAGIVVMSACYSGLADRTPLPGDDLFGLQRALLSRGAKLVVASLWDVYDETAPMLMNSFFQQLQSGQPAAAALSEAQRQFLKTRRKEGRSDPWVHPYFWAMFTAVGSDTIGMEPVP